MTKKKKLFIRLLSVLIMISVSLGILSGDFTGGVSASNVSPLAAITKLKESLQNDLGTYFDGTAVSALPDSVEDDTEISVIVSMKTDGVVDGYLASTGYNDVSEYAYGAEAQAIKNKAETERKILTRKLDKSGISYKMGETYDNVVSGFEITVKAKDFYDVEDLLKQNQATAIVGEVYEKSKYQKVINTVDVDKNTGIFTNTTSYTGEGVIVAILDTGLDYTHTAFAASEDANDGDLLKRENGRLYKYSEDGTKTEIVQSGTLDWVKEGNLVKVVASGIDFMVFETVNAEGTETLVLKYSLMS